MAKDMAGLRTQVLAMLPGLMGKAMTSYRRFAAAQQPKDPKGFATHHAACRAALAHMELLIRLARWAETNEVGNEESNEDVTKLIAEARAAMAEMTEEA